MLISVAVVAYNESIHLPSLLKDISNQDYPHEKIEILLINSNSTDKTESIMIDFINSNQNFYSSRYFINPKGSIPSGHNIAVDNFIGDALIRIDAHASVPSDFISKNVSVLKNGEFASGGRRPCVINRDDKFGKLLLSAENSLFGSGFAPYRTSLKKVYTSSLFCGMYRREVYETVGKYNELLPRSEDNEMCYRIRKGGFRLCYSPNIIFFQQMRNTLGSMLKQKLLNGYWVGKTLGISPKSLSLFHLVPLFFIVSVILTTFFAVAGNLKPSILLWSVYILFSLSVTVLETIKLRNAVNVFLPIIFILIHFAYGIGTLIGFLVMPFWLIINKRKNYD